MTDSKAYKVGIYLRLSREENNKETESGSIGNQRDIIHKYIRENNLLYVDEYVDDGVSGTTFDREGMNRLIQDIESKRINMVITKDLSRLGRNQTLQLQFLDYLSENNVNYVALLDNINTFDENNPSNEMMSIQMFFNEKHVRDTSKKMKMSVHNKRSQGNFLGPVAPYGYKKDPENKYKLLIEEESAKVVKKIFDLSASGVGVTEISRILTSEKIPIPSEQKKLNRGLKSTGYGIWNNRTISDILQLPTYIGNLTQGRLKKPSYKSKKIIRPKKEDWIVVENSCPQIIDKETFEIVQNMFERNKNQTKKSQDILLKGLVYCKECGHTIGFRQHKQKTKKKGLVIRCYGNCNYWAKHKKYNLCTPHNIKYQDLEDLILKEIRKQCKVYLKENSLKEILKNNDNTNKMIKELETKKVKLEQTVDNSVNKKEMLYNDKLEGLIDIDMYKSMSNRITEETIKNKEEIEELSTKIYNIKNKMTIIDKQFELIIKEYISLKKPSVQLLSSIISKIVIDESNNIDIYYKFKLAL